MLRLYVSYNMKKGCREAYMKEVMEAGIVETIRKEEGCLAYDFYFDVENPDHILLIEAWTDAPAQQAHMQTPHIKQMMGIKAKYCENSTLQKFEFLD